MARTSCTHYALVSRLRHPPRFLLLLCLLCSTASCLVQARTVPEHQNEARKERDHAWSADEQSPEMSDFWPILCPDDNDYWFSKELDKCQRCSSCPDNQVVIRPCYRFHDAKCATLEEMPEHFLVPSSYSHSLPSLEFGGNGNLPRRSGRDHQQRKQEWKPTAVVLSVITGVLVLALLVTSVAICVVWRKLREEEPPKPTEKLVCTYSPAPSETV